MDAPRLDGDIRFLKGVGEKRAELFLRLGLRTPRELLSFYPRDYEDRTHITEISSLADGVTAIVAATVTEPVGTARIRGELTLSTAAAADGTGRLRLVFFNRPYVARALSPGARYLFWGRVTRSGRTPEMAPADFRRLGEDEEPRGSIVPFYPLTGGLTRGAVASAVGAALELAAREGLSDPCPTG